MKKAIQWLNAHWGIIVAAWAAILLAVFIFGNMNMSDRIQAASVITLVFITLYYAVQTQLLVREQKNAIEEERKRRNAEFGRQRIEMFLRPLPQMLEDLSSSLCVIAEPNNRPLLISKWENSLDNFQIRLNLIDELFAKYMFMAGNQLRDDLNTFLKETKETLPTIENQDKSYTVPWKERIENKVRYLKGAIVVETSLIFQHIRKTYGYDSPNIDNLEGFEDMTVLSNRPPTRI